MYKYSYSKGVRAAESGSSGGVDGVRLVLTQVVPIRFGDSTRCFLAVTQKCTASIFFGQKSFHGPSFSSSGASFGQLRPNNKLSGRCIMLVWSYSWRQNPPTTPGSIPDRVESVHSPRLLLPCMSHDSESSKFLAAFSSRRPGTEDCNDSIVGPHLDRRILPSSIRSGQEDM
jgi:hypothetical protein